MKYCFRIIHLNRLPIAYIQNCFCWIKLVVRRFLFLVKRRDSKVLIIFFFIHKVCPQIIYISCDCGTSVSDIFTFSERIRNTCFTTIQYDMITGKNRKQLVGLVLNLKKHEAMWCYFDFILKTTNSFQNNIHCIIEWISYSFHLKRWYQKFIEATSLSIVLFIYKFFFLCFLFFDQYYM